MKSRIDKRRKENSVPPSVCPPDEKTAVNLAALLDPQKEAAPTAWPVS